MSALQWQTTYPCLATVMEAHVDTLIIWHERLPAAQTDVERTVRRRIESRINQLLRDELRSRAPEVADKLDDVLRACEKIGLKTRVNTKAN